MSHINVEIKARCGDQEKIRKILRERDANFKGTDHQIDTYFNVSNGRLKLREGNIENFLIYYERENIAGPKQSNVTLYAKEQRSSIKRILEKVLGVSVVVDKMREIFFIENVKFHLDRVQGLGTFVEIEAIDRDGTIGKEKLSEQCNNYLELFKIKTKDLLRESYGDLLLRTR